MESDEPIRNVSLTVQFFSGVVSGSEETFRTLVCLGHHLTTPGHGCPLYTKTNSRVWSVTVESLSSSHSSSRSSEHFHAPSTPLGLPSPDTYLQHE